MLHTHRALCAEVFSLTRQIMLGEAAMAKMTWATREHFQRTVDRVRAERDAILAVDAAKECP